MIQPITLYCDELNLVLSPQFAYCEGGHTTSRKEVMTIVHQREVNEISIKRLVAVGVRRLWLWHQL